MKDISNEQRQILIIHINDVLGANTSTDEKSLQIEFPVAPKFKIFEQPIQSKLQRKVLRDDPSRAYLETLENQTTQGNAVSECELCLAIAGITSG